MYYLTSEGKKRGFLLHTLKNKKPKKVWPAKLLYLLAPAPFIPLLPITTKHYDKSVSFLDSRPKLEKVSQKTYTNIYENQQESLDWRGQD